VATTGKAESAQSPRSQGIAEKIQRRRSVSSCAGSEELQSETNILVLSANAWSRLGRLRMRGCFSVHATAGRARKKPTRSMDDNIEWIADQIRGRNCAVGAQRMLVPTAQYGPWEVTCHQKFGKQLGPSASRSMRDHSAAGEKGKALATSKWGPRPKAVCITNGECGIPVVCA